MSKKRTLSDRWFYHPSSETYGDPQEDGLSFESVHFESEDCELHGWFFPALGRAKGTVVHSHGNAGNITGHYKYVGWMPKHGWNVLVFDYRGFGHSDGTPTRAGVVADLTAAIDYAKSRRDVDKSRLVLFGQSLGGAVAIVVAAGRDDLRGIAVEGAFSSYRREAGFVCAQNWLLWSVAPLVSHALIADGFDAEEYVARIAPTPIFFITGTADTICDYRQTLDLHAAAGEPKDLWVIDGGSHTGALVETNGEGKDRIDAFFHRCIADGRESVGRESG